MVARTILKKVPMNILRNGDVVRREAPHVSVDPENYRIFDYGMGYDFSQEKPFTLTEVDKLGLEKVLEETREHGGDVEAGITALVSDIMEQEGDRILIWPLISRLTSEPVYYNGHEVPDWLVLDVYNAHLHGNPAMWNPYGVEQPADSIILSALEFIRTYDDFGLLWYHNQGTLNTILTPNERKTLSKLKTAVHKNIWLWENKGVRPVSVHGYQALSDSEIILPLRATDPMFHSLLGLGTHAFFRGTVLNKYAPIITIPPWIHMPKNGQSLSDVNYKFWPFKGVSYAGRRMSITNPVPAELGRIFYSIGVPIGREQKYDGQRYVLNPVSQAFTLLQSGVVDNLLRKIVEDYLETYLLMRGAIENKDKGDTRFILRFFGHRFPLPPDYNKGDDLDRFIVSELPNIGLADHLRLIDFLLPDINYWIRYSREVNTTSKKPYYIKLVDIYFWDVDGLMDLMPKLKVHYKRPKWR